MRKIRWLVIAYILMLITILGLPLLTIEGYSIIKHTTSQLAAQNTPYAWVMNAIFCLLGASSILEGWLFLKSFRWHQLVLTVFGWALIMTALFQHAPIDADLPFDAVEDRLHSLFASITGWAFTIFAVSSVFIERSWAGKSAAVIVALAATVLSVLIFSVPQFAGIWQRLIFIFSFGWLLFFMSQRRKIWFSNWKASGLSSF